MEPHEAVLDRSFRAIVQAVEADHAAGVVDPVVLGIDAGSLAAFAATSAVDALRGVNGRAEQGEAAHQAEGCADGADGVAVLAAPEPCAAEDEHEGYQAGDQQRRDDGAGGHAHDAADDAPVGAVRGNEGDQHLAADDDRDDGEQQYAVAYPFVLRNVVEALKILLHFRLFRGSALLELLEFAGLGILQPLPAGAAEPDDHVLEDAHRADDGTIDAAEEEAGQQDDRDYDQVQGQGRRQELEFGHPAPPVVADAHEEQGDPHEEDRCQGDAEFS